MNTTPHRLYLSLGGVLTLAQIAMVWMDRYLPLYDYPVWLYEAKCMHRLWEANETYARVFELASGPVPNLGFVGAVTILSSVFSLECSGKILLSLCIFGFPWVWLWSVRRIVGEQRGLEYLGFPFALNLFFWGRTSYLLGLIAFIGAVGWVYVRRENPNTRSLLAMMALSVVFFFMHGAIFALWGIVVVALLYSSARPIRDWLMRSGFVLFPGVLLAFWYSLSAALPSTAESTWGLTVLGRNILKPLMLFVKSYGVPVAVPPSVLNGLWLLLLGVSMLPLGRWLVSRDGVRRPLVPAIILCLVLAVSLPNDFAGIVSLGGYFVLPALFLMIVSGPRAQPSRWRPLPFLLVSLVLTVYAFVHVQRVDDMMEEFVNDLSGHMSLSGLHTTIGYDWPAASGAGDALSASVNPLFGAQYYLLLETEGLATIHETSVLRLTREFAWLRPMLGGATRQEYYESVLKHAQWCRQFRSIAVTGGNQEAGQTIALLQTMGFTPVCTKPLWTILVSREGQAQQ